MAAVQAGRVANDASALPDRSPVPPWQLLLHGGADARLLPLPAAGADHVRVQLLHLPAATAWQVQLSLGRLALTRGQPLLVAFRLRADQPSPVGVSLAQDHDPWRLLSSHTTVQGSPNWTDIVLPLWSAATDRHARLVLDLGAAVAAVEVGAVIVRRRDTSDSVVHPRSAR